MSLIDRLGRRRSETVAPSLICLAADGTDINQLTTNEAQDWNPDWAKDGRIYFSSDRSDASNIWSVIPEFVEIVGEATAEPISIPRPRPGSRVEEVR